MNILGSDTVDLPSILWKMEENERKKEDVGVSNQFDRNTSLRRRTAINTWKEFQKKRYHQNLHHFYCSILFVSTKSMHHKPQMKQKCGVYTQKMETKKVCGLLTSLTRRCGRKIKHDEILKS